MSPEDASASLRWRRPPTPSPPRPPFCRAPERTPARAAGGGAGCRGGGRCGASGRPGLASRLPGDRGAGRRKEAWEAVMRPVRASGSRGTSAAGRESRRWESSGLSGAGASRPGDSGILVVVFSHLRLDYHFKFCVPRFRFVGDAQHIRLTRWLTHRLLCREVCVSVLKSILDYLGFLVLGSYWRSYWKFRKCSRALIFT